MHIERIQIDDGFLDGLDLTLVPGLNVVIGARGTGKTSLIELLRFCLRSQNHTQAATKQSLNHAQSVLGAGEIVLSISDRGESQEYRRSTDGVVEDDQSAFHRAIVFSQMEIEHVGLEAAGRIKLLDDFVGRQRRVETEEAGLVSEIRSTVDNIESLRREAINLQQQVAGIEEIDRLLKELEPAEQGLQKVSVDAAKKKELLDRLGDQSARSAVTAAYLERFESALSEWREALGAVIVKGSALPKWTGVSSEDPLATLRPTLSLIVSDLTSKATELDGLRKKSASVARDAAEQRQKVQAQSRVLRKEVEDLQKGAGDTVRQVQHLKESRAKLADLGGVLAEVNKSIKTLTTQRNQSLDRLDSLRFQRFQRRKKVVDRLNESLGPRIRIDLERAGQYENYSAAITACLRGSGIRHSDLSDKIAATMSPRELLDATETSDVEMVADVVGVSRDRTSRLLGQLRESEMAEIATCLVEDNAIFQLLDGKDYKNIEQLSTGQRCTVILPIILEHTDQILIVDQPEDHIDNAFIAETLIKALQRPLDSGQIILSTHNANIPVLGEAQIVTQLGSDGRHGHVVVSSGLADTRVVTAITDLMEGGAEAFRKRAAFYKAHRH